MACQVTVAHRQRRTYPCPAPLSLSDSQVPQAPLAVGPTHQLCLPPPAQPGNSSFIHHPWLPSDWGRRARGGAAPGAGQGLRRGGAAPGRRLCWGGAPVWRRRPT